MSWSRVSKEKSNSGLGIKDVESFNIASNDEVEMVYCAR